MKKSFIIAGLGMVGIVMGGYVFLNLKRDADVTVVEQQDFNEIAVLEQLESGEVGAETGVINQAVTKVKEGVFVEFDPLHKAEGSAVILQTTDGPVLALKDFKTSNGPDLFVYLSSQAEVSGIKAPLGEVISLGVLKKIEGDQVYKLPENFNEFQSVVIWCRAFDINFSSAQLLEV